jgi:xanthine dehydrogenase YagR molybdenum-binding subunit
LQGVTNAPGSLPDQADHPADCRHTESMLARFEMLLTVLGETRVRRIVGVYGAGRIINPKTSRSQCIRGMIGGIGMALMEHFVVDPRNGRITNANLAEYAVPVHADASPVMDVTFVEEHDPHVNPLGVTGLVEIAIVGVASAIASAVFHATGKRIRELPITPDKLL